MLKLYCLLTGEDYQMLKTETPESKKKIALIANCLFIPTFLWLINGFLIVHQVLQHSLKSAIIAALCVSFIIFIIERIIIMSSNSRIIFSFRIIMGLCIATIGSIAFDEVIFNDDIDQQVVENFDKTKNEKKQQVAILFQKDIDKQAAIVQLKYNEWKVALDDVNKEADGTGGSHQRGVNGITKIKQQSANLKEADYNKANNDLASLKNSNESRQNEALKNIESSFNAHSLLIRLKAMFDLIAKDFGMALVYVVFSIILFICEFIVVLVKMNSKESNYERKVKLIEQLGKQRMEKIANKDSAIFDPGRFHPNSKQSKAELNKPYPSLFKN